jgi:hypothetical protein
MVIDGGVTSYELEVLRAIAKGAGRFGWHKIERRLSNVRLEERGYLPDVLGELTTRGLVRCTHSEGRDTYEITGAGRRHLM